MKLFCTKIRILFLFFTVLPLLLFTACQTDYRADAAEKARTFALKNTKDLSETDRDFIRYSDPEIMSELIFRSSVPEKDKLDGGPNRFENYEIKSNPGYDYMHTAFVWQLPQGGFSVVVDGSGERTLRGWGPDTILYKRFVPENTAFTAAHIRAIQFLVNFFPELDFKDINRVRFTEPTVLPTTFLIDNPEEQVKEKQIKKWMDYIRTGKGLENEAPVQISLVWTSPVNGEKIVVCGTAPKQNLTGWVPKKALLIAPEELKSATNREIKVDLKDPKNEKGEQIITPDPIPYKKIEMNIPQRTKTRS